MKERRRVATGSWGQHIQAWPAKSNLSRPPPLTVGLAGQRARVKTITADNGTEFNNYRELESSLGAEVYGATPHHAWERGPNENTNGLLSGRPVPPPPVRQA